MRTADFEKELKALDKDLAIVPNVHRPGLSNVKLRGADVCPVPGDEIRDEMSPEYTYVFPNGLEARHNGRKEALAHVNRVLELIKTKDGHDAFFGVGDYAA